MAASSPPRRPRAFSLPPGFIAIDMRANRIVLDPNGTALQAIRKARANSTKEQLFLRSMLGDGLSIAATSVEGDPSCARPPTPGASVRGFAEGPLAGA